MERRRFIEVIAGGLLAEPLASEAQQVGRMYRIGYLFEGAPPDQTPTPRSPLRALEETLRELGYVEGRNLVVERRFAAFKYDRLPDLAAELVRLKPDLIVTGSNPSIAALKRATTTVPIVMAWAIDPAGAGLVTSLARPGGNITGSSLSTGPEFIAKQLEILNEIVPKLSRVAILRQTGRSGAETAALESAARKLGLTILFADVRTPNDIEGAFATMTRSRAGAFLILGGSMTWVSRQQIADLAVQHRLPGIHFFREYAEAGLLLTYGPNSVAQYRRAATYIDKILKGARPADIPVQEPTEFELVVNARTAKSLGLKIPPLVLQRADEVIHPSMRTVVGSRGCLAADLLFRAELGGKAVAPLPQDRRSAERQYPDSRLSV
jgi:putative ABC transport system substrate-binding protein